jgi:hypothetical protein
MRQGRGIDLDIKRLNSEYMRYGTPRLAYICETGRSEFRLKCDLGE